MFEETPAIPTSRSAPRRSVIPSVCRDTGPVPLNTPEDHLDGSIERQEGRP